MRPIIGNGFGAFSRILGPWTDYFPAQLNADDSQYGLCVGTQIKAGKEGATISAITVDTPFNIVGNVLPQPWRCIVMKGAPPTAPAQFLSLQLSTNGWPNLSESDQLDTIQWSKMFAAATNNNNATQAQSSHFAFPDFTGPHCGSDETLSVLLFPLFNDTGVPAYGVDNQSFVSLSVWGAYFTLKEEWALRSIPLRAHTVRR